MSNKDAEFDAWLRDADADILESLHAVVDTEASLLTVKQSAAHQAVAVAHASGSDEPDRAIRSVLAKDSDSTAAAERASAAAVRHSFLAALVMAKKAWGRIMVGVLIAATTAGLVPPLLLLGKGGWDSLVSGVATGAMAAALGVTAVEAVRLRRLTQRSQLWRERFLSSQCRTAITTSSAWVTKSAPVPGVVRLALAVGGLREKWACGEESEARSQYMTALQTLVLCGFGPTPPLPT